jgi:hypothetical protein
VRGKYAKAMQKGYSVRVLNEDGTVTVRDFVPKENAVLLDPDVKAYFPDSESVNHALRSLINLIPEKRQAVLLKIAEGTDGSNQASKEEVLLLGWAY